ncbi:MAG: hypothetical protein ACK54K_10775 [Gemmatimonadaceae bacterium]
MLPRFLTMLAALTVGAQHLPAQAAASRLSLDDLLDVRTTALGALSDDGRWAVALMARPRTGMGVDYNRTFGDPTYASPARREAWVIDTRSGARTALFADPRALGPMAWSPDGGTLAVLVQRADDQHDVLLWDRATRRTKPLAMPTGRYAFPGTRLRWSDDGRQLTLSLRSNTWRTKAAAEFARLTVGPRIVMSSEEPFLAWNGLQRMGTIESVVRLDVRTGATTDVLPEAMRQQWQLTRDGTAVV